MSFIIGDSILETFHFREANKANNKFNRCFFQAPDAKSFVEQTSNIDKDSKGQTRSVVSENKKALNIVVASENRKLSEARRKRHITRESNIGVRSAYTTKSRTTLESVNRLQLLRNKRLNLVQKAQNNLAAVNQDHITHSVPLMGRKRKAGIIGNS